MKKTVFAAIVAMASVFVAIPTSHDQPDCTDFLPNVAICSDMEAAIEWCIDRIDMWGGQCEVFSGVFAMWTE